MSQLSACLHLPTRNRGLFFKRGRPRISVSWQGSPLITAVSVTLSPQTKTTEHAPCLWHEDQRNKQSVIIFIRHLYLQGNFEKWSHLTYDVRRDTNFANNEWGDLHLWIRFCAYKRLQIAAQQTASVRFLDSISRKKSTNSERYQVPEYQASWYHALHQLKRFKGKKNRFREHFANKIKDKRRRKTTE